MSEGKLYVVRVICIYFVMAGLYFIKMGVPISGDRQVSFIVLSFILSGVDTLWRLHKKQKRDKKNG